MNIEKEIVKMRDVLECAEGVSEEDFMRWDIILSAFTIISKKINLVEEYLRSLGKMNTKFQFKAKSNSGEPSMNESVYKAFKDIGGK